MKWEDITPGCVIWNEYGAHDFVIAVKRITSGAIVRTLSGMTISPPSAGSGDIQDALVTLADGTVVQLRSFDKDE